MSRTARSVDLPLALDPDDPAPMPAQLAMQLRALIADGTLGVGEALPSTRALAARLRVSRGTVVEAFEQLSAEGYLEATRGSGTRVHPDLAALPRPAHREAPPAPTPRPAGIEMRMVHAKTRFGVHHPYLDPDAPGAGAAVREGWAMPALDLRPGIGLPHALPSPAWRSAWREAAALDGGTVHGSAGAAAHTRPPAPARPDPLGDPHLRAVLADRLRRVRAVRADPAALVVTAGARDGLRLLLDAVSLTLPERRLLRIGVESPGYPSLRRVGELLGHTIVDVPADADGLDPAQLPADLDLLIVTPSHQYPIGGSLPAQRRLEILERARAHRILVVEDDHTAEWRWEGAPLPALAGLDDGADPRVALLSSLSSLLFRGMSVGHLAVPPWLEPAVATVRATMACPVSTIDQAALARYIGSGAMDRRVQRLRAEHRRRLTMLRQLLADAPGLQVEDVPGGLTAVVRTTLPEADVLRRAADAGVLVGSLARYWSGEPPRPGIVVGFDGEDAALHNAIQQLKRAIQRPPEEMSSRSERRRLGEKATNQITEHPRENTQSASPQPANENSTEDHTRDRQKDASGICRPAK